jgi:hypothetical protein
MLLRGASAMEERPSKGERTQDSGGVFFGSLSNDKAKARRITSDGVVKTFFVPLITVVYCESRKREPKIRLMNEGHLHLAFSLHLNFAISRNDCWHGVKTYVSS